MVKGKKKAAEKNKKPTFLEMIRKLNEAGRQFHESNEALLRDLGLPGRGPYKPLPEPTESDKKP